MESSSGSRPGAIDTVRNCIRRACGDMAQPPIPQHSTCFSPQRSHCQDTIHDLLEEAVPTNLHHERVKQLLPEQNSFSLHFCIVARMLTIRSLSKSRTNPLKTALGPSRNDGRNPVGAFINGLVDPKKVTHQADPELGRACIPAASCCEFQVITLMAKARFCKTRIRFGLCCLSIELVGQGFHA